MEEIYESSKIEYPRVNRDLCTSCAACPAACPMEALVMEGLRLVIDAERCRPCGQAAMVCPTGALECPIPRVKGRTWDPRPATAVRMTDSRGKEQTAREGSEKTV